MHRVAATPTFSETYAARLTQTEAGIAAFCDQLPAEESDEIDEFTRAALDGYTALLRGPGKRIRGVLAVTGHEWGNDMYPSETDVSDGDAAVASGAAGIVEALHAYLLGFDDMADRSSRRRGLPTVHAHMTTFLQERGVGDDAPELARSYTEVAGLILQHEAQATLLSLPTAPDRIQRAAYILNKGLARTGYGQGRDMLPTAHSSGVRHALQTATDKTAHYTFTLPFQIGAALAGAPLPALHDIEPYAFFSGVAFQVRDDIIGIFGDPTVTGKDVESDIKEGKTTILVALAREKANERGQRILDAALGNTALGPADVQAFLDVIRETALELANALVDRSIAQAIDALPSHWPAQHIQFLHDLAISGAQRQK